MVRVRVPTSADATGPCSDGTDSLPVDSDVSATEAAALPAHQRGAAFLRSRGDILVAIAAGGALGSLARLGVSTLLAPEPGRFPWSTFVENVSGGLALGCLMVLVLDVWPSHRLVRPFLGVGLLGGYTTFSTYMLDTRMLLAEGHALTAMTYLFASLFTGVIAVWIAIALTRQAVDGARQRRVRRRKDARPTTPLNHDRRNNP